MKHSPEKVKATLLTILDELGGMCNPVDVNGCVYYKADATDAQHNRCIIGELLHRLGETAPNKQGAPWSGVWHQPEHYVLFNEKTHVFLGNLQAEADDRHTTPWVVLRPMVESWDV